MKGKIDSGGILHIERLGILKRQYCKNILDGVCGDWCPFFCEPKYIKKGSYESLECGLRKVEFIPEDQVNLTICEGKTFTFIGFTDERIQGESSPDSSI